ncbi:S8 family serine peptidase [Streptomyces sp. S.PB5]|uniref:S8 family serine peptidase n=1 Tax=Streptomyces sp. S.PB5 TaxID=3020844 RepID=UPI0025B0F604|nr:S8 family serine peptidase [Streptomyces sp. S.PB5]MDN3026170.1 S8 family serine peptidase [Streptomyces sp. S.PB5]
MASLKAAPPPAVFVLALVPVAVVSLVGAAPAGTDPLCPGQYGLELSGVAAAAGSGARADAVVVAVLDTGVDLDHPDLAGALVAGLIAARAGIGIVGGAPGARIMPVRVLGAGGTGDPDVIADAVRWALGHGADVINLFLDHTGPADRLRKDGPLSRALREVTGRAVVVTAAGNEDRAERICRAGVRALVVQTVGPDGQPAAFSDVGDPRSVAVPGVDILSTVPHGYVRMSGTSMAAPHVAALAALLLGRGADAATVREVIAGTPARRVTHASARASSTRRRPWRRSDRRRLPTAHRPHPCRAPERKHPAQQERTRQVLEAPVRPVRRAASVRPVRENRSRSVREAQPSWGCASSPPPACSRP